MSPSLHITSTGWLLKINDTTAARSFDSDGLTTALFETGAFVQMTRQQFTPLEDGAVLEYASPPFRMTESIRMLPSGLLQVERSWVNHGPSDRNVSLVFEVRTAFHPTFTLIPCVSYNGNQWGTGLEPKGLAVEGKPWVFSYKRTGLPAATFSENREMSVGIFTDHREPASLCSACSLEKTQDGMAHRILWPEREEPKSYIDRDRYGPAKVNTISLTPGQAFTVKCYVSVSDIPQERAGWTETYDRVQDHFAPRLAPHLTPEQVWEMGVHYAKNVLFQQMDGMAFFHIGLLPHGNATAAFPWKLRQECQYEIGWCGQNITFCHALLHDYSNTHDEGSLAQATQVLDAWTQKARFSNGLFAVRFDDVLAGLTEIVSDTCNLGWGSWQTLRAYEKARSFGLHKPEWLTFGLELCDFFTVHSAEQGRFGKLWTQSGECVDWEGTVGCFILLPLLEAYRMTRRPEYLERALRGFEYYVEHDLNRMECTAGALDTYCIDKETCWPLLASALDLYELTGETCYLKTATLAGYYTLSWMFHFDALYDESSDFRRYGYRTLGATAVSTQHHHLDPWGALLCRDWLRLYTHTGDARWLARAQTTWANSLLCLSDGTLRIHNRIRPEGSQNEGFLHCHWGYSGSEYPAAAQGNPPLDGRLNDWLVAWPGAFRLLTLMDVGDWGWLRG